jgi:O-antigen ligase
MASQRASAALVAPPPDRVRPLGIVSAALLATLATGAIVMLPHANQIFAVLFVVGGLTAWLYGFRAALVYGLVGLFSKGLWLRIAYHLDSSSSALDAGWLGSTPALFLTLVSLAALYEIALVQPRVRRIEPLRWLWLFGAVAALTVFIPGGSPLVKLAGLQRQFFPAVTVAALGFVAFRDADTFRKINRALLYFSILAVAYALVQHLAGMPFWERSWFESLYASKAVGLTGWLTVGPAGLEFRVYSCYYSYTEFFFTTVGIALLNLGMLRSGASRADRRLFGLFAVLFLWLLAVTLERMPILMLLAGVLAIWTVAEGRRLFRKRLVISAAVAMGLWLVALFTLTAYLNSGIDKLVRLAELTNPFAASSIQDRVSNQWSTSLAAVAERPWGWGPGYGSATRAAAQAARSGQYVAPHNELLQKAVELGIVGMLVFAALLVSLWRYVWRRVYGGSIPEPARSMLVGYLGMFVAYLLCGMVNLTFSGTMGVLFWMTTGAAWSVSARLDGAPVQTPAV